VLGLLLTMITQPDAMSSASRAEPRGYGLDAHPSRPTSAPERGVTCDSIMAALSPVTLSDCDRTEAVYWRTGMLVHLNCPPSIVLPQPTGLAQGENRGESR
jgi:hypothetical protein